jgi:HAD superfamily hydrolase (TIGR01549 family)
MVSRARAIKTLLFDWDGTLADSAGLGFLAFKETFRKLGVKFDQEFYDATYSPNWYSMYERLGLPRAQWQMADELWIEHYGAERASLVAGATETILDLHRKGYRLGIVSSGTGSRIHVEMAHTGLGSIFQVVICNEHISNKKPHPEGLDTAMRMLGSHSEETGYVGDSPEDIEMGKRAGVLTVGVRSAYPSSARLISAEPDILLDALVELLSYF